MNYSAFGNNCMDYVLEEKKKSNCKKGNKVHHFLLYYANVPTGCNTENLNYKLSEHCRNSHICSKQ